MTVITQERDPAFPLMHQGSRLYLLARTDIYQMNPGKGWAHGGHAATQFVFDVLDIAKSVGSPKSMTGLQNLMNGWRQQGGGGFGTKIALALTKAEIIETVATMRDEFKLQANTVVDPTYPFTNWQGDFYTAKELTGGYVFVPLDAPAEVLDYLRQFKLHP